MLPASNRHFSSRTLVLLARATLGLASFVALFPSLAHAGPAKVWRLGTFKDLDEGEADGMLLSSLGEAQVGYATTRSDVPAAQVFCSATGPDGTVYLGTGDQADVLSWDGKTVKKIAHLEGILVSAITVGGDGTVYAGTLPGARIFEIKSGQIKGGDKKELPRLEGADQVWSLVVDGGKLYAATGPAGKLFAIDLSTGKNKIVWESGERHLLSMARASDGALIVGSSEEAILYRVDRDGKARALHDFAGDEVRAIARAGDTLYVAVNEFDKPKSTTTTTPPSTPTPHSAGTRMVLPTTTPPNPTGQPPGRDRKGKGAVFRVDADGRVEQLIGLADGYFTALAVDKEGNVYAAAGANGRVYLMRPDHAGEAAARGPETAAPATGRESASPATVSAARTALFIAFNLPERQVLTLALDGAHPILGTGDAGGLYSIDFAPPKIARWFSKAFDAGAVARFGSLRWAGEGAVTVETRSGNTARPDRTWSDFQGLQKVAASGSGGATGEGKVASPSARYLQLRLTLGKGGRVRETSVYYQPQNQRARVTEVTVGEDAAGRVARPVRTAGKPRSPIVKVRWKADNPDEDELVFRLFYRDARDGDSGWRPIGGPDAQSTPLTVKEYDWNTEGLADGMYVAKVVASDERGNPRGEALAHELATAPFLVDNRKPEVDALKVDYPSVSGVAKDSYSALVEIAYAIDGGDWQLVAPKDGVLDDPSEEFGFKLPDNLAAGPHSLAIRATDSADNPGVAQVTFRVKR